MKIGFIDYYLSEWHANNYPAWIKKSCERLGVDFTVAYAYAKKDKSDKDGVTTDEWCKKFGVTKCNTIAEVVEKSDCMIVLSPDNPEFHEELAELPLKSGKPVFIDKTFALDLATAKRMFSLADKHKTPMFSCSALRFAKEIDMFRSKEVNVKTAVSMGCGNFPVYAVHIFELMNAVVKAKPLSVTAETNGAVRIINVEYEKNKKGLFIQTADENAPYQLSLETDNGSKFVAIGWDFFDSTVDAILNFFTKREPKVAKDDTLQIIAMIEKSRMALENPGKKFCLDM